MELQLNIDATLTDVVENATRSSAKKCCYRYGRCNISSSKSGEASKYILEKWQIVSWQKSKNISNGEELLKTELLELGKLHKDMAKSPLSKWPKIVIKGSQD
ncbi:hypothetical protein CDAR_450041 [Caerostris darwini]|uniref:Uncharacterized protein n=1 Tax=Caerostris darwini TaxID=1538125 RepID=A0AAV4QVG7_9ARAC|nr:hypothetical protein CDAR_450041 [Caerostris darwini]